MASAVQSEIGAGRRGRAGGEKLAVVCNTGGSPERELTYLTLLQRQRAAAVVLTGGAVENPAHLAAVSRQAAAARGRGHAGGAVRPPAGAGHSAITLTFDNRGGGQRLTEHLLGPRPPAARLRRRAGGADDDPPPTGGPPGGAGGARASTRIRRLTVHGRYDRALGLRRHPGAAPPGPRADGRRRRERHRRDRGVRGAAGPGLRHPRTTCPSPGSTTCRSARTRCRR